MASVGERFAAAVAAKDVPELNALLSDDVDFKALTPQRFWEANGPDQVAEVLFGSWFTADDAIEGLTAVPGDDVADTSQVGYRFDVTTPDGPHVVEQQAYYRELENRICYIRIVCSGFRPAPA